MSGLGLQHLIRLNKKSFKAGVTPGFPLRCRARTLFDLLREAPMVLSICSVSPVELKSKWSKFLLYLTIFVNFAMIKY